MNELYDELGMVAGTLSILIVGHSFILGIFIVAWYIYKYFC